MKKLQILALLFFMGGLYAQENLDYQKPAKEILELADVNLPPTVSIDQAMEYMVLVYRDAYKSIEELSGEELRLAGLRINPQSNIGSRTRYYSNLKIKPANTAKETARQVSGLPEKARLSNFSWSPDQKMLAFTHTAKNSLQLWILDIEKAEARKLSNLKLNANLGDVVNWFEDGKSLLVKVLPDDRQPLIDKETSIPSGPTISVADGRKAQNRTYQDLLKDKNDEHNFEQLARSELHRVGLDGSHSRWLEAAMYSNISFSPDGNYVMVSRIEKPFSYLVPFYRFPSETSIYDKDSKKIETVLKAPLIEDLPKGFMAVRRGRRSLSWRSDKAAVLVYIEALDGGDPENECPFRDAVYALSPPFSGEGKLLVKTRDRYAGILWGNDEIAIVHDRWWNTRNTRSYVFSPSTEGGDARIVFDRNYQDRYNDPGRFVSRRNQYGSPVLSLKGSKAFLLGAGFSPEGQFPFLDQLDLRSLKSKRLYQSAYQDKMESLKRYDAEKNQLLVQIQSPTAYPNFYLRDIKKAKLRQLTYFTNPFHSIQHVHKEVIHYKRDDGLALSGTLYLPVGYDLKAREKMPMILWAYPIEFKDKSSAGQTTANPNQFTYPYYGSPIYWVARGYVVLDGATFPIVGEGDEEPNDSFRKQLVANAKAAIDAVDSLGYIDPNRVAVGGHSYGAFMVANLLSHSDLFAAGIARSGAYNRTLTPFGFQSEERNYWEAPEVYYNMSPFMHADKMKTPLLLIHGEADNNSGTYPLQSQRYFNALKGLGATVRLVMLPKESHGYAARESILHMLWEQDQWLERWLKNGN